MQKDSNTTSDPDIQMKIVPPSKKQGRKLAAIWPLHPWRQRGLLECNNEQEGKGPLQSQPQRLHLPSHQLSRLPGAKQIFLGSWAVNITRSVTSEIQLPEEKHGTHEAVPSGTLRKLVAGTRDT